MTLAVAGTAVTTPVVAADPDELLVRDEFSRVEAEGWGVPAVGSRWMYPTGRNGLHVASGVGVMEHWKRATPRLMTVESSVRDATIDLTFSLDRVPLASGVKVMTVARKSTAGQYRAGVRIGAQGKVWLSLAKARNGGDAKSLGQAVAVAGLRYRAGDRLRLKTQVLKQDPTQLRAKVWLAGTSEPAKWQLVHNDGSDDIGRGGNVGVRSVMTEGETASSIAVRVDRISVNRAQNTAQTTAPKATPTPKARSTPKPTPKPKNAVYVPSSIDATGSKDASAALTTFVAGVPDGSRIVFKKNGVYRMDGALRIKRKNDLELDGNGATLSSNPKTASGDVDSLIHLAQRNDGIVIHDFHFDGNDRTPGVYDGPKVHALLIGGDNVEVYDVTAEALPGDFVKLIGSGTATVWSKNVHIHDATVETVGRNCITVIAGQDAVFERVDCGVVGYVVFNIEPNESDEGARNIVFRNNTATSWDHAFAAAWGAAGSKVDGVVIRGNTVTKSSLKTYIFPTWGRENITITNNTSKVAARGPVLYLGYIDGLTVKGNNQPLSSGELARINDSTNVTYVP